MRRHEIARGGSFYKQRADDGAVQLNDTRQSVKAMKKMDIQPVVESTFESILLLHLAGNVSSNPPMNEIANITSKMKKAMLNPALVASSFNAEAPKMR